MSMPAGPRKLRILCLHGYHGSADILQQQMSALASRLPPVAEFVCVDAPSLAKGDFGWWHAVDDAEQARGDPGVRLRPKRYLGWPATRDGIVSLFAGERFDGIFGFSQGAALTGLLVGLRSPAGAADTRKPLSFDFAMMVGGFVSNDPSHASLYESHESYELPSLHMMGRSDTIVPMVSSRRLASRFERPAIVEHDGGHVIAGDPQSVRQVADFLEQRLAAQPAPR